MRKRTVLLALASQSLVVFNSFAQTTPPTRTTSQDESSIELAIFEVSETSVTGYRATSSVEGTRLNTPLANIPQSIDVYTEEFFRDLQAVEVRDVIDYQPTVQSNLWGGTNYRARGFTGVGASYLNGVAQRSGFGSQFIGNVDRIEVLKGPSAILYGADSFGALINRVTKRPTTRKIAVFDVINGSHDYWRAALDLGGPLWQSAVSNDRKLLYRTNLTWEDGKFFKEPQYRKERLLAPSLTLQLSRKTSVTFDAIYSWTKYNGNYTMLPVTQGRVGFVGFPDGTFRHVAKFHSYNEPSDVRIVKKFFAGVDFRHAFNRNWQFRSQFFREDFFQDFIETIPLLNLIVRKLPDGSYTAELPRNFRWNTNDGISYRTRNELTGQFKTGPISHRILAGHSWDEDYNRIFNRQTPNNAYPTIDVFNPIYGNNLPQLGTAQLILSNIANNSKNREEVHAFYFNELLSLWKERVYLQAGWRKQEVDRSNTNFRSAAPKAVLTDSGADTFSYGLVFHILKDQRLTFYANRNEGFIPNFQRQPDGEGLGPITGEQLEAGFKFDLISSRLTGLVSVYQIKQEGIVQRDFDRDIATGIEGWYHGVPGQTSEGVDLSLNTRISNWWNAFGGYSLLDVTDTRTGLPAGDSNPRHSASVFNKFSVMSGPLKGLNFTLGTIYKSERQSMASGNLPRWWTPKYFRVDTSIGYKWKLGKTLYSVSLRVRNLMDKEDLYFIQNINAANLEPTRDIRLQLTARF